MAVWPKFRRKLLPYFSGKKHNLCNKDVGSRQVSPREGQSLRYLAIVRDACLTLHLRCLKTTIASTTVMHMQNIWTPSNTVRRKYSCRALQGESRLQSSQPSGQGRHLQQQRPMACSPAGTRCDKRARNTLDNLDEQHTPSEGRLHCFTSADTWVLLKVIKVMKRLPRAAHSCK